jgi:hypothetical protein
MSVSFRSRHFAFVPDVTPRRLIVHYYRPHVVVLVPFFSILLGSSLALRKEMMMFGTGSVPLRIDTVFVLSAQNEARS